MALQVPGRVVGEDCQGEEEEEEVDPRLARRAAENDWREYGGSVPVAGSGGGRAAYGLVRQLRREERNPAPRLHSIRRDALFLAQVRTVWPELPVGANLRCGLWYCQPPPDFTCYFKSTDGHTGQWQFNLSRLNAQVVLQAAQHGGCILVDSTRKGKQFPDSMSRTIPIWASVINRACYQLQHRDSPVEGDEDEKRKWYLLGMPPWVGMNEKAQIEKTLDRFVEDLLASDQMTLSNFRAHLKKPLRPVWIAPEYPRQWGSRHDCADVTQESSITPLVLVSIASTNAEDPNYIQGAGDDEESWAMGLTPPVFWEHHDYILEYPSQEIVEERIREVVEQEKRRRLEPLLGGQECNRDIGVQTLPRYSVQLYQIGATSITVSDDPQAILQPETRARFGLIINCTETEIWESLAETLKQGCIDYLHVPLPHGKRDKHKVGALLASALPTVYRHLRESRAVLIYDCTSLSVASFLCAAVLLRHFGGTVWNELRETQAPVDKALVLKVLLFVAAHVPQAKGPSRALMKELNKFFMSAKST